MMIKTIASLLLLLFGGIISCTTPKEARILKKTTKQWRESSVVLDAYADTPFSGIFLTLRDNGKFEHTSSGLIKSFEAGTWTKTKDTLQLTYLDSKQNSLRRQNVVIDKQTSTLIFEGHPAPTPLRLKLRANKL
jgi:hypothetical protein